MAEALDLRPGEALLEVSAEGESLNRPSVLTVHAGVVSTGPTAIGALEANSVDMNRVLDAIRRLEVDARDIRTTNLTVQPRIADENRESEDDPVPPRILGYVARNNIELRLRSIDRAPTVIGALFAAGANYVEGPDFSLDPSTEVQAVEAARRDAATEARAAAESYARAFGLRVGRTIRISERSARTDVGSRIVVTGTRIPTIEPGEIATQIRLWVDYALVAD